MVARLTARMSAIGTGWTPPSSYRASHSIATEPNSPGFRRMVRVPERAVSSLSVREVSTKEKMPLGLSLDAMATSNVLWREEREQCGYRALLN